MKINCSKYLSYFKIYFACFLIATFLKGDFTLAEDANSNQIETYSSTKSDNKDLDLPANPFELVEMIRRANSMNNATSPSDAIDEALKSFDIIENEK